MDRTALILEDSHTQAMIIGKMIESKGWSFVHFDEVRDATDALSQMRFQALFLDVFVRQYNTLLHMDRFRHLAKDTPIVIMTAGSNKDSVEETLASARRAGADYVLRKPFSVSLIEGLLTSIDDDSHGTEKRRHVLVIDDSSTVRAFCVQALEGAGYRVSQAGSMEEAFYNVDIAHVDLVLCDIFMPGMGGLKGMRTIKTTWPKVVVISMSAGIENKVAGDEALEATRRFGIDGQLPKPFKPEALVAMTRSLLGREPNRDFTLERNDFR